MVVISKNIYRTYIFNILIHQWLDRNTNYLKLFMHFNCVFYYSPENQLKASFTLLRFCRDFRET